MPNSIEYAKKFVPIIDGVYKAASVTQSMDAATKPDFTGANEVSVLKVSTTGLGDYSREDGYPKGDVTAAWETLQLTEERGKEISIDRMDDEETLGLTFGTVTGEFMRLQVIPELDAYRFAKYAGAPGISAASAPAVLTKDTILAAIDEAARQMDADEVPQTGQVTVKTGTSRSFSVTGDRYNMDDFQDALLDHDLKYGVGQTVIKPYVYFNQLTGKGERGKVSIAVEDDLSGAAGENASFSAALTSTVKPTAYTYTPPTA